MTDHITKAKAQADRLDIIGYGYPTYEKTALRGILHGILALHEQNAAATKPFTEAAQTAAGALREKATARTRQTPTKETSK